MRDPELRRVNSHRYPGYDYAQPGMVFITVCTEGRQRLFGTIGPEGMLPSPAGHAVMDRWHTIPHRFPGVGIDFCVVMPDHIHGILAMGIHPDHAVNPATIGDVVRWLKNAVLRDYATGVKQAGWAPYDRALWQRDYHDRIIRNDLELETRRTYMAANPSRWWNAEKG